MTWDFVVGMVTALYDKRMAELGGEREIADLMSYLRNNVIALTNQDIIDLEAQRPAELNK